MVEGHALEKANGSVGNVEVTSPLKVSNMKPVSSLVSVSLQNPPHIMTDLELSGVAIQWERSLISRTFMRDHI